MVLTRKPGLPPSTKTPPLIRIWCDASGQAWLHVAAHDRSDGERSPTRRHPLYQVTRHVRLDDVPIWFSRLRTYLMRDWIDLHQLWLDDQADADRHGRDYQAEVSATYYREKRAT